MKHKKERPKDNSPRVFQEEKLQNTIQIKPLEWTEKQKNFIEIALNKESKIIFLSGSAGTSKTILSTYCALELLNQKRISDIIYVRSAVESADSKLGFLPGELSDKMSFYGQPFIDKLNELLNKADVNYLVNQNKINILPINYLRGLNWNAKCIIVDEAQNLTQKELITTLTRIGKFSKCFVLADCMQNDINGKSGYLKISKLFNDEESQLNGIFNFEFNDEDIMRSELVKFLVKKLKVLC